MPEENIILRAKGITWRAEGAAPVPDGKLVLTRDWLRLVKRRSWWGKPQASLELEISRISAVSAAPESAELRIELSPHGEGEPQSILLSTRRPAEAGRILSKVQELRRPILEEKRKAEEREREAAESRTRRLNSYQAYIWTTAGHLWELTRHLYRLLGALRQELWDEVAEVVAQVERKGGQLQAESGIDIGGAILPLRNAASERQPEQIVQSSIALLKGLTELVERERAPAPQWQEMNMEGSVSPAWRHLPYLLLFTCLYRNSLLSHSLGDKETARENCGRMDRLSPILEEAFGINLRAALEQLSAALEPGAEPLLSQASNHVEHQVEARMRQQLAPAPARDEQKAPGSVGDAIG